MSLSESICIHFNNNVLSKIQKCHLAFYIYIIIYSIEIEIKKRMLINSNMSERLYCTNTECFECAVLLEKSEQIT